MDQEHPWETEAKEIKQKYNCSDACVGAIQYLRARSRWSEDLEQELVRLHKEGIPPNIYEFGHTEESQNRIQQLVNEVSAQYENKA